MNLYSRNYWSVFFHSNLILLFLLLFYSSSNFAQKKTNRITDITWQQVNVGTNQNLNGMSIQYDPQGGIANMNVAGGNGDIWGSTNGGQNWYQQNSPMGNDLNDISPLSGNDWAAVGNDGTALFSSDGGSNWNDLGPNTGSDFYALGTYQNPNSSTDVWAFGQYASIYHTSDMGATWNQIPPLYPYDTYYSAFIQDPNTYHIGGEGSYYKTTNGGQNWSYADITNMNRVNDINFPDQNNGVMVGDQGAINRTTNGGASWSPVNSGTHNNLNAVDFQNGNDGIAVGDNGTILQTSDGGNTWNNSESGTSTNLYDVQVGEDGTVFISGEDGKIITNVEFPPPPKYILTTAVTPAAAENSGCTVTKNPNLPEYERGTIVSVQANPANGWSFVEWQGDLSGNINPGSIGMNSDKHVIALFRTDEQRTLTVNISPPEAADNGCSTVPAAGAHTYDLNTELNVHAIPNPSGGWHFVEWTGNVGGTNLSAHLVMDADKDATANFEFVELTVSGTQDAKIFCPEELMNESYQRILPVTLCANETDGWNISKIQFKASGTGSDHFDTRAVKVQKGNEVIFDGYYSFNDGTIEATFNPPVSVGPTECVTLDLYYLFDFNAETYANDEGKTFFVETNSVSATPWEHSEGLITGRAESKGIHVGRVYTSRDFVFGKINQAVESEDTQDGDICYVCPGTYVENVELKNESKGLTIKSKEGKEKTFINFDESSGGVAIFRIASNNTTVDGFTINGNEHNGAEGVRVDYGSNVNIINNTFGQYLSRNGVSFSHTTDGSISNNYFDVWKDYSPIYISSSNGNTISNNNIKLNYTPFIGKKGEIVISHSENNIVENNYSDLTFEISLISGSNGNKVLSNNAAKWDENFSEILLKGESNNNKVSGNKNMKITCNGANYNVISENETGEIEVKNSRNCTIDNNIVTEPTQKSLGGIKVGSWGDKYEDKFHYITNNKVYKNFGNGIYVTNTENSLIEGNVSKRNIEFGISVYKCNKMEVNKNICTYNGDELVSSDGIHIEEVTNIDIVDNRSTHQEIGSLTFESYGLRVINSSGVYITGNILLNNCTGMELENVSNVFVGINTVSSSLCLFTGASLKNTNPFFYGNNILNNNGIGIHLREGALIGLSENNIYGNTTFAVQNDNPSFVVNLNNNFWGSDSEPDAGMFAGNYQLASWLTEETALVVSHQADTVFVNKSGADTLKFFVSNLATIGDVLKVDFNDNQNWLTINEIENVITDTAGVEISIPLNIPTPLPTDIFNKIKISVISENSQETVQDSFFVSTYIQALSRLAVFPDSVSYSVGDSVMFYASAYDQLDNQMNTDLTWSTSKGVIRADGLFFTDSESGLVEITATNTETGIAGSSRIYVSNEETILSSIAVLPDSLVINSGDEIQFTYSGYDNNGMRFSFNPIWLASGGSITNSGFFRADTIPGVYSISVIDTLTNISGEAIITILNPTGINEFSPLPATYSLSQNYPNPFNPTTTIQYAIPFAGKVRLEIYNILGQRVDLLVNQYQNAGIKTVQWNAGNFASGIYLIRMIAEPASKESGVFTSTRKMILLK